MDDDRSVRAAADAFQRLSNEFRVAILYELASAGDSLTFSELMAALEDPDSGRLNYHLDELAGTYVRRADGEYALTIQGAKIVSSVLASRYVTADVTFRVSVDGRCYGCDAADLRLRQTDQQAVVDCRACDRIQFRKSVPTSLWADRDPAAVPAALDRVVRAQFDLASHGVCEYCHAATTGRVVENDGGWDHGGAYDFDVLAVYECERCTNWKIAPHGLVAWLHPDVRAFHRRHGVDPQSVRVWQVDQVRDDRYTTVTADDPREVQVRFPREAAECRVTFDDASRVVEVVHEWSA